MIIERHYDEESIISFLEGSDATASRDPHLSSCTVCAETLASFRSVSKTLKDPCVWEGRELREQPVTQTLALLRHYASSSANEDAQAEDLVRELLTGPREWWGNKLRHDRKYFTAGVVRKLIAATDRAIDTMPPDAVEITLLAVTIAEALEPSRYPSETVMKLRAAAWRERAYAWFYTGQLSDAVGACDKADALLAKCTIVEYDKARLDLVRSLTYRQMDRVEEAIALTKPTAAVFARFGDQARVRTARSVEALLYTKVRDYKRALEVWHELEQQVGPDADIGVLSLIISNMAVCYRALGDVERAMHYDAISTVFHEDMDAPSRAIRVRWNLAQALCVVGRYKDALERLMALRPEFLNLGMTSEAAFVSLEVAELLIMQDRTREAAAMCKDAMAHFESAGVLYTARALTAVSYLQECARAGRATPKIAQHVRTYVRRLPNEPELLFVPPPLE